MKRLLVISAIICVLAQATSAQDSKSYFINEFSFSLNQTDGVDNSTIGKNGFGMGVYKTFRPHKVVNLVLGVEFNHTKQIISSIYEGHTSNATDVTYNLNYVSIPLGLRVNLGKKTKFFIETGAYADLFAFGNSKGTRNTVKQDESGHFNNSTYQFKEKVSQGDDIGIFLGLGVRVPISSIELIIKPDYKFGLINFPSTIEYNRYFRLNIGIIIG